MTEVNENSTAFMSIDWKDQNGAPAAPTAVTYRIDCMTTKQQIRAWTAATPAASTSITLTPADNAIKLNSNRAEKRRVTAIATYGAGDQQTEEHDYQVRNLEFVV